MRFFWIVVGAIAFLYLVRGTLRRFLMPKNRTHLDRPRSGDPRTDRTGTPSRPKGFTEQDDIRDAKYRDL